MIILDRKEALQSGMKHYFTGKPCKHGHIAERRTDNGDCTECMHVRSRDWYAANPEKADARNRVWWKNNPEKALAKVYNWRKANPEKHRANRRAWRKANPEKHRASFRAWQKANPEKVCAHVRARDARKLRAMPVWACKESIESVYAEARRLTIDTGIKHHVDHIIPLKNPKVCGLHVHYNLQAIPAVDNMRKGNQFQVEVF